MKLETYLAREKLSIGEFALLIHVSHETVRRYLRVGRIPESGVMRAIVEATGGKVRPNDFYS